MQKYNFWKNEHGKLVECIGTKDDRDGKYVLFTDHEQEVERRVREAEAEAIQKMKEGKE